MPEKGSGARRRPPRTETEPVLVPAKVRGRTQPEKGKGGAPYTSAPPPQVKDGLIRTGDSIPRRKGKKGDSTPPGEPGPAEKQGSTAAEPGAHHAPPAPKPGRATEGRAPPSHRHGKPSPGGGPTAGRRATGSTEGGRPGEQTRKGGARGRARQPTTAHPERRTDRRAERPRAGKPSAKRGAAQPQSHRTPANEAAPAPDTTGRGSPKLTDAPPTRPPPRGLRGDERAASGPHGPKAQRGRTSPCGTSWRREAPPDGTQRYAFDLQGRSRAFDHRPDEAPRPQTPPGHKPERSARERREERRACCSNGWFFIGLDPVCRFCTGLVTARRVGERRESAKPMRCVRSAAQAVSSDA